MPTYEYRCRDCNRDLEIVQSFHDAALTECPSCGGNLRKRFGSVGITFKGSGFYRTDSRVGGSSEGGDKASKSGDKAASESSSGDKGGDAKPTGGDGPSSPSKSDAKPSSTPAPAASSTSTSSAPSKG